MDLKERTLGLLKNRMQPPILVLPIFIDIKGRITSDKGSGYNYRMSYTFIESNYIKKNPQTIFTQTDITGHTDSFEESIKEIKKCADSILAAIKEKYNRYLRENIDFAIQDNSKARDLRDYRIIIKWKEEDGS